MRLRVTETAEATQSRSAVAVVTAAAAVRASVRADTRVLVASGVCVRRRVRVLVAAVTVLLALVMAAALRGFRALALVRLFLAVVRVVWAVASRVRAAVT